MQESRLYPNRFNRHSTHDQNRTKHALPRMQSSPAETAEKCPMQRQQQRPQVPVTEPYKIYIKAINNSNSRWRTPPWRKTPLMTNLQMRSRVRCLPTRALQWGKGQSLPFPDHLPARPLAWTTHQGHVALVGTPTGTTEQNTVSRSGGSGGRGRGRLSNAHL